MNSTSMNFYSELVKDLIPAVEKQYHTYAKDVTKEGIHASKWHRAFSGFSMGGVCTWGVFDHCIDQIGCYIPISGDSWIAGMGNGEGSAKYLAETFTQSGYKPTDFRVYAAYDDQFLDARRLGVDGFIHAAGNFAAGFLVLPLTGLLRTLSKKL